MAEAEKKEEQREETHTESAISAMLPKERSYSLTTLVLSGIFFLLTVLFFVFYVLAGGTLLYNLFLTLKKESVDQTIGGFFGSILAIPMMILFGLLDLPANTASIILFKNMIGKSGRVWANILFIIFFILSILLLVALIGIAAGIAALILLP